jgi:glutamyl-Q tRNA(Asp) synthetase
MSLEGTDYRGRFAPSPTGPLHLGSLLTAWGSWLLARKAGGRWLVRIEDLDPPREVAGAAALQLRTLAAFGLESDEAIVRQSDRDALYQSALDQLLERGHAFLCHCSRRTLAASGGVHRHCEAAHAIDHPSVRFRVPVNTRLEFEDLIQGAVDQDVGSDVGDFVLKRADGPWAYQLAVVVDDAAQDITDVVRGADLLGSTPRQILLQRALGLPTPRHAHLPLLLDADGRKLSKSLACAPVDAADPLPALRIVWAALGQHPTVLAGAASVAALQSTALREFDPSRIPGQLVAIPALSDVGMTPRP